MGSFGSTSTGSRCPASVVGPLKPGSSSATVDSIDIAGEYALVTWRLRWEGGEYVFAADTYHVHDGKILLHTSAFLMRS